MINKKKLFLWSLYSYGSAIVFIVFTLFFSQWIVIDRGLSDFWFNATYIISSLLLIATAPVIASIADKHGTKLFWLRISTILCVLGFLALSALAHYEPAHTTLMAGIFTLGIWMFVFSGIFFSSLLNQIGSPDRYGVITGFGQCSDWLGEISGVFLALLFTTGLVTMSTDHGRASVFLPATIIYFLCALPLLVFFKQEKIAEQKTTSVSKEYKNIFKEFIALCKIHNLGWFFLAFFFFNDAIITASNNFTIYLDRVFGIADNTKSYLLLAILVSSALGAVISGKLVDRFGFKKSLKIILIGWIIILPTLGLLNDFRLFAGTTIIMGLWFGSVWVITRVLVATLTPPEKLTQAFTYYSLMERFSTLVGPLAWGIIIALTPSTHGMNYRIAILCMTIFVIIGSLCARKIFKA